MSVEHKVITSSASSRTTFHYLLTMEYIVDRSGSRLRPVARSRYYLPGNAPEWQQGQYE